MLLGPVLRLAPRRRLAQMKTPLNVLAVVAVLLVLLFVGPD